jgi:hypothetical protein
MGLMRFLVPEPRRISAFGLECAHLAAPEGVAWRTWVSWNENTLVCRRDEDDSGVFFVPWQVEGRGEPVLSTTCLRERREPYHLPVELARGLLHRLRNQMEVWRSSGMQVPEVVEELLHEATGHFIRAAVLQDEPIAAALTAQQAIETALNAADLLTLDYAAQLLTVRKRQTPKLGTLFAGGLEGNPPNDAFAKAFRLAFNSALIEPHWSEIEANTGQQDWQTFDERMRWCAERGFKAIVGPLLELGKRNTPHWLYLWEDNIEALESYVYDHIQRTVEHCQGAAHVWIAAARMNAAHTMALSEQHRLRLTVGAIDTVRRLDAKTPVIVTFDQPWGEFLARGGWDLSPLHFADALVRAELGLSGLGLEINWGYWPGGSPARDLLEVVRLIDRWSMLNLPLIVFLTVPSADAADPQATLATRTVIPHVSLQQQQHTVQQLATVLASKPWVHGVVWRQVRDAAPHDFPHGGLFDHGDRAKPALSALAAFRRENMV